MNSVSSLTTIGLSVVSLLLFTASSSLLATDIVLHANDTKEILLSLSGTSPDGNDAANGTNSMDVFMASLLKEWIVRSYELNPETKPEVLQSNFQSFYAKYQDRYKNGKPFDTNQGGSSDLEEWWTIGNGLAGLQLEGQAPEYGFLKVASDISSTASNFAASQQIQTDALLQMYMTINFGWADLQVANQRLARTAMASSAGQAFQLISGINYDPSLNADAIAISIPSIAHSTNVQTLLSRTNNQGDLVLSVDYLQSIFTNDLQILQSVASNNLTLLTLITTNQLEIYRYITNATLRSSNQQQLTNQAPQRQSTIQQISSEVTLLSTIVGLEDPALAHQMQVVGASAVTIADSINKFTSAEGLDSVIFTGNILGAAMNVVGLFGNQGPSPNQQILSAIGQIKLMLNQLSVQMNSRFDRVDKQLNIIYQTINDDFKLIDFQLGKLQGDVTELQTALFDVQSDLYRVEGKVFSFLDAGFRRSLNDELNLAIGYRATYGELIPWDSYKTAEDILQTWATVDSKDNLASGASGRGYQDSDVYSELTTQPLESNLNWLNQYLNSKFSVLGVPPFTQVSLANFHDWSIAASAYLDLELESPMNARRIDPARLDGIYQAGLDLARACTNITLISTSNGLSGNFGLFNALLANYREKAATFKEQLTAKELEFRLSISPDPYRANALSNLNLWGGGNQNTPWSPVTNLPPAQDDETHGVKVVLSLPAYFTEANNLVGGLAPLPALLADLLSIGSFTAYYGDYDFTNRISGYSGSLTVGNVAYGPIGDLQLAIKGEVNGKVVFYRRAIYPKIGPRTDECVPYYLGFAVPGETFSYDDACGNNINGVGPAADYLWEYYLTNAWYGSAALNNTFFPLFPLRTQFGRYSQNINSDNSYLELLALNAQVEEKLRELQRGSYNFILGSLGQANGLQEAAQELSGSKLLLQNLVALGFSHSLENDDSLRSLLFSPDGVVDTEVVQDLCELGISRSFDTNSNTKVDIGALTDERISAFENWITNRLAQIDQYKTAESFRLVTSTLERIKAFEAARSAQPPPPFIHVLSSPGNLSTTNAGFHLAGEPNVDYQLQASSDLVHWTNGPVVEGETDFSIPPIEGNFLRMSLPKQ